MTDPIDEAIAATEPPDIPKRMKMKGIDSHSRPIEVDVPFPFDSDAFESAVAMMMQMRVASEQAVRDMNPMSKVAVPDHRIVGLDGKPILTNG